MVASHAEEARHRDAPAAQRAPATVRTPRTVGHAGIGSLQRLAGNRAVNGILSETGGLHGGHRSPASSVRRRPAGVVVQRHGSPEHLMLGQVNPKDLRAIADARDGARIVEKKGGEAKLARQSALHVLLQERARVRAWQNKPPQSVDDSVDPDWQVQLVRVVPTVAPTVKGARVDTICTYGEMNMLADYFGSVEEMKAVSPATLRKVLQTEREDYYESLGALIKEFAATLFVKKKVRGWLGTSEVKYYLPEDKLLLEQPTDADYTEAEPGGLKGQDFPGSSRFRNMGPANKKLNDASMNGLESVPVSTGVLPADPGLANFYGEGKGTGTAWGVTARNACHFAPESWRSWEHYHNQALELAQSAEAMRAKATAQDATKEQREQWLAKAAELANEAWVANGFGDHYLQDSFASGHLVNKSLVMQWFTERIRTYKDVPGDRARLNQMLRGNQEGIAPSNYSKDLGVEARNPQAAANQSTAQEGWATVGLTSVAVSDEAKSLFAAWRVDRLNENRLRVSDVAKLDRSSLPQGSPFPSSPTQAAKALAELSKAGLCLAYAEKDDKEQTYYEYRLHDADQPSRIQAEAKRAPGANDPDRAVQTATANMYHEWLNNSLVQAGAGALHDHFCVQGLWVGCEAAGDELFKIYGDYAMLSGGGGKGAEFAAETAQMSQDNVRSVLTGAKAPQLAKGQGVRAIMDRFPDRVVPEFKSVELASQKGLGGAIEVDKFDPPATAPLPLDNWHEALHGYMEGKYLAKLFDTWAHSYVSRVPGLGQLTSIKTVSPHSGEEF